MLSEGKKAESETLLACYLLGVPFDLEDGGNKFLRNVGKHLPDYTASQYRI
jgi:hypothetical protein